MLDQIEQTVSNKALSPDEKTELKLDIGKIPEILLDNTDRNRTSPFAFTGNRFEFRAVGSSANTANPMLTLSTAVAHQLKEFKKEVDMLRTKGLKKDDAIFQVLKDYIVKSKSIRFEGDGYSKNWLEEARERGLTNVTDVPTSFSSFASDKSKKLFEGCHVLSSKEIDARLEIRMERFTKKIQIESRVLGDLAINHIIPNAIAYQTKLITNVQGLKELYSGNDFKKLAETQLETIKITSKNVTAINQKVHSMTEARKTANNLKEIKKQAAQYSKIIRHFIEDIRIHIDDLELIVDDELWTMPKYRELLFTR